MNLHFLRPPSLDSGTVIDSSVGNNSITFCSFFPSLEPLFQHRHPQFAITNNFAGVDDRESSVV